MTGMGDVAVRARSGESAAPDETRRACSSRGAAYLAHAKFACMLCGGPVCVGGFEWPDIFRYCKIFQAVRDADFSSHYGLVAWRARAGGQSLFLSRSALRMAPGAVPRCHSRICAKTQRSNFRTLRARDGRGLLPPDRSTKTTDQRLINLAMASYDFDVVTDTRLTYESDVTQPLPPTG